MALFKISKGLKDDLVAQKPTEGFCWFTTDDGKFYIDTATSADPAIVGTNRIPLNAYEADKIIQNGSDGPFYVTTTGTAAVTTTGALNSVVWTGTTAHGTDDFDTLTTGLMIMVKFPTAGHSYGITLNVNGLGAKPLVYNNAKMTTHYGSGTAMLFMYDAASPALSGYYNNNAAVSYAANYGCWRAMADYDTTNIYQLRNSGAGHLAQNKLYRYQLLLTSATNTSALIPINSVSNNTGTSKTLTTDKFNPFGPIYYYATTSSVNAGDGISSSYVYVHYVLDLRYSFNTGSTLVQRQAVFIVAEPQADGSAVLHTDPISQTLPSTDNGLIYIYVGQATSTTSVELALQHPVYQYKNGRIQAYTGGVDVLQATGTAPLTLSVSNNKNVYTISGSIADATQSTSGLLTAADKTKLDSIETGAEVNQDAFAHIKIGDTYITADSKTDTVEFVGSNITLTPDNANDKLTIGLTSTNVVTALGYTPPQQDTTYSIATQSDDGLMSAVDKAKLDGISTGAEVNQNAFGKVKVGSDTIDADLKIDTLELAGSNVTLTPDTTNDKVTIGITSANVVAALGYTPPQQDTTYSDATQSTHGLMSTADKIKLDGIATGAEVNQNTFSNIKVGNQTVAADMKTDTVEFTGTNVTITPDTANDTIDFEITSANVVAALGYTPPTQDTTYGDATQSVAGLMSTSDKTKLDGIATGAEVNQNAFSKVAVTGQTTVEADGKTDTLNLAGSNISISTDAATDTVTIGLTQNNVVAALGYTPPTQDTTYNEATQSVAGLMSATDKTKLDGVATGAEVNQNAFSKVAVSGQTTVEADAKTDTLTLAGDNITLSTTPDSDTVTIGLTSANVVAALGYTPPTQDTTYNEATQSAAGLMSATDKTKLDGVATGAEVNQNAFTKVAVSGQTTIEADAKTDTLTLAGDNVTITTTPDSDTVTIGLTSANVVAALGYTPPTTNTTYGDATQSASGLMSATDKTKLDGVATGAEVNQNAFSNIKAGANTAAADSKTDTIEFVGSNIGIAVDTNDTTNDKITFSLSDTNVITALGYTPPTQDTTYNNATQQAAGLMSAADKTKLDGIATGAEINQNAFSNVKVGSTTVAANSKTDTVEFIGSNIGITANDTNDTVTFSLSSNDVTTALGYTPPQQDTTYTTATQSAAGLMSSADKTKLDGIETGAEINQNAFSSITVDDDQISASTKTDNIEFTGRNVTITPDGDNNTIEFAVTQRNALTALDMKIFFGVCTTVASTAIKEVVCPGFTADDLVSGTAIWVKFANTNSASVSTIKLAVNNTTEKPIKYMYNNSVSNLPSAGYLLGGQTYLFHYDGTNWVIDNLHYNTNTTYSSMSQTEAETGTATTSRLITAARLKGAILYHAPSGSNTTPAMDGTAAVGTETTWAHGDHVHPTDTTRAAVATTVTNVAWDTNNNKLTQTINGTTSDIVTASTLKTALGLSSAMLFMGSLGTGGTITTLPAAAAGNQGYTYKVITAGTYAGQAAQVGDVFISTGSSWELVPSGDEPVGTVTSVAASGSGGITISGSPITSSGTIAVGLNLSTAINGLSEGTAAANRNDYVVAQYAGGGTSNTTYYRRKVSNILAAMNSSDVTTALGYTPYNSSNPNGYTSNEGTVTGITAGTGLNTTSDDTDSDGGTISTSGTLYLTKTGVTANSYGPSANASPAHAGTFSVPYITVDKYGRVTAASTKTITLPSDSNTDTKVRQSATTTSDWRKILLHYTNQSSATAAVQDVTNETYAAVDVAVQPSTATVRAKKFMVAGTAGATNTISSDATTNMYFTISGTTSLVITNTAVRSSGASAGTIDLGTSSNKWNNVYANYFYGDGSHLTNLPTTYWANLATTSAAAYNKAPEVASIKIGNGTTATATKGVTLQYNATTNAIDFIFV